jgi:isopentenyl-diphosphate Delta-isomerase
VKEEVVVLVDAQDRPVGILPKRQAHLEGRLHRAVSVFVFNERGEMLLQRRAAEKYHSGGLWSNACCSHPRPGETLPDAARRRLREEMGLDVPLDLAFTFTYRAELDAGLTEHEFDHVYVGTGNEDPRPDPAEVEAWRWVSMAQLRRELEEDPGAFTAWFPVALRRLLAPPTAG